MASFLLTCESSKRAKIREGSTVSTDTISSPAQEVASFDLRRECAFAQRVARFQPTIHLSQPKVLVLNLPLPLGRGRFRLEYAYAKGGGRKDQFSGSYGDFKPKHIKGNGERYPNDVVFLKAKI